MTPKAIVDAIEEMLGITGRPLEVRNAIERVLLENGVNEAAAAERTHQLHKKVKIEISQRRDIREAAGEIAILHLRGQHEEILHGSSHVFQDDRNSIKKAKLNRIFVDEIYTRIRDLSFAQFEVFSRCVLRELGCKTARITPHAGDQGIDFYGELTVGDLLGADPAILKLMHETRLIFVGQAKHYPSNSIGPSTIRELVGALALSRTYTFSRDDIDLLDDISMKPFSPVMALLFSTGEFTKGARNLAQRAGLITFSGWQLAVFLADKGVGLVADTGQSRFDASAFDAWLC